MKEKLYTLINKNKLFFIIIIFELLYILLLLTQALITPQYVIDYKYDDYIWNESIQPVLFIDEQSNTIGFDKTENQYYMRFRTVSNNIPAGSYNLTVEYNSDFQGIKRTDESSLMVEYCEGVTGKNFILDGAHNTITSPFWIKNTVQIEDFYINMVFTGAARSEIYNLSVKENVAYRFLKIMFLVLVFAICDVLWWMLFAKRGKSQRFKVLDIAVILTVITLIASLPYLSDIFYEGHDIGFHMMRIQSVAKNLSAGQFPVRMMYDMCNEYGYPNSIFYCDIFLYFPAILFNMGLALQNCYKVYAIAVTLFTTVITYMCAMRVTSDKSISVLTSALYVFSAYRIICVYTRTAVGEYTAMSFFPLVVLGIYLIYTTEKPTYKDWLPLSLGMSGILMSHILSTEIVGIMLIVFVVLNIFKTLKWNRLIALLKAVVVTFMICMWFIVPFLEFYLTQTTNVSQIVNNIGQTGIYPLQLFALLYHFTGANINNGMEGEMSLCIGTSLIIVIAAIIYYYLNKEKWKTENDGKYDVILKMIMLASIAVILSLKMFPWAVIQNIMGKTLAGLLGSVQFVWRYLSVVTVLLCFAGMLVIKEIKKYDLRASKIIVFTMIIALIANTGYYYYNLGQYAEEWECNSFQAGEISVGTGEYYLLGTDSSILNDKTISITEGNVDIISYNDNNAIREMRCKNTGDTIAKVEIPVFSYKYYKSVDSSTGNNMLTEHGSNNRIKIIIPAGYDGTVKTVFEPPLHWRISEIISLLTVLLGGVWLFIKKFVKSNKFISK